MSYGCQCGCDREVRHLQDQVRSLERLATRAFRTAAIADLLPWYRSTGTLSWRDRHVIAWLSKFKLGLGPGRYLG
jgi:hypothetical protein